MRVFTPRQLTNLTASLLTTGALLMPSMLLANTATATSAPSVIAMSTETQPTTEFRKLRKKLQPLNLSVEQQEKVNNAIKAVQADATQLHDEIKANKTELNGLQFADQYNAAEAQALAKAQGDLVQRMITLRTNLDRQVYDILTPEQRQQLQAEMAEREQRKAEKRAKKAEKAG